MSSEVSRRGAGDYGDASGVVFFGKTGAFAPDFEVFRGRSWESRYPDVLLEFYRTFGSVGERRLRDIGNETGCAKCCGLVSGNYGGGVDGGAGSGGEHGDGNAVESGNSCDSSSGGEVHGTTGSVSVEGVVGCDDATVRASGGPSVSSRGPNWERNRAWKQDKKRKRDLKKVPQWRVGAAPLSPPSTVVTVDSRTAEEIEAARTLAVRRTFENRLAVVKTKHQLASYADKDKTEAIKRLEVARIEERINTTKAKSQASYKKCDTPLNSVGSAGSAGEFAWKQEIRKRDAVQKKSDYYEQQLELAMKYLPDVGKRAIAELPEPYIPSLEDIEFEDADISPYYSREEMEAEAAKWVGNEAW